MNPQIKQPDIPNIPDDTASQPSTIYAMAYGSGSTVPQESDTLFKVERGTPRYRNGRLLSVLPQFRGQKLYVKNNSSVPTNVPLTQPNPAVSPFLDSTTGRVTYPSAIKPSAIAPVLP